MRQIDLVQADEGERKKFAKVIEETTEKIIHSEGIAPRLPRFGQRPKDRLEHVRDLTIGSSGDHSLNRSEAVRRELDVAGRRSHDALEAIVLEKHRPAWFIEEDTIQITESDAEIGEYPDLALLKGKKTKIENLIVNVGRVDLFHHAKDFVGTGWLVDEDIVVTNAHVALQFCQPSRGHGWDYMGTGSDNPVEARLDTMLQRNTSPNSDRSVELTDILYVGQPNGGAIPDMALFRIKKGHNLEPLGLDTKRYESRVPVGVVGYPGKDDRNDAALMRRLFGVEYNVKRFSPGYINSFDKSMREYLGDYTTLGGSSGSAIISLDNLKVVGLHFAGLFRLANYAVPSDLVASALRSIKTSVRVTEAPQISEKTTPASDLANRSGYDSSFLGDGDLAVSLPSLGSWAADVAPVSDDADDVLKYTNFSVIQSKSRRLPLLTAVNIDGEKAVRLKRGKDKWFLDGRLAEDHQIGNILYVRNDLDRGHLVRRLDPVWGDTQDIVRQAERDSFHYTNSAPQHKNLNRYRWLRLEDYVLDAASTQGFKASVFTGPIFRDDDRKLKVQPGAEDIPIPEEFWKIAVMVNADTGKLSVTAYVLSQGNLIRDMTESAFVYGQFKVYQVKITKVEAATGLDFGKLRNFDPLVNRNETSFREAVIEITSPDDLML